ncbi:hypothetical protein [Microbacterium sp. T2.11-28]|uniref:hypothetical protein n=1 Tax=Microbacterium sp. T2.11-28 TaxID=3041169 RepID=UPI0024775092|nr:hypothetical protein [Microbacterium sp. T2.11-28]CAI9390257.1 hypothetical protein MICABA_01392 [Microbacterium sp. T2.11-28]
MGSHDGASGSSGKVDAAKQEAADVKDTAVTEAKEVLGTVKEEAATVVGEAKSQAKDLFAQGRRELTDQANSQQQRLARGLRSTGDELGAMASGSGGAGLAGDVARQVSSRLSAAATWLGERDAQGVVMEVKRFARRKPGTFILGAALAGVVIGRLTRALASSASEDTAAPAAAPAPRAADPASVDAPVVAPVDAPNGLTASADRAETPIYAQTVPAQTPREGQDDRPDAL